MRLTQLSYNLEICFIAFLSKSAYRVACDKNTVGNIYCKYLFLKINYNFFNFST